MTTTIHIEVTQGGDGLMRVTVTCSEIVDAGTAQVFAQLALSQHLAPMQIIAPSLRVLPAARLEGGIIARHYSE